MNQAERSIIEQEVLTRATISAAGFPVSLILPRNSSSLKPSDVMEVIKDMAKQGRIGLVWDGGVQLVTKPKKGATNE